MKEKVDFRIQRTYKLLTDAMINLLNEKDFESITVSEICEKAMIRRATFYKHFGDKYELYAFIIRQLEDDFKKVHSSEYDKSRPQTFYAMMIRDVLCFADQHRTIVSAVFKSSGAGRLTDILSDEIESDIYIHLKNDKANGAILPCNPKLMASMITGALVYTIKRWLVDEMDVSKEEMINLCMSLLKVL
ncbi:MAG: TetR/AcrR family transcriptional regulator [Acutalibacteraceae bacterium]